MPALKSEHKTVLLIRQFRLPVFLNRGRHSLVETPAGLLDGMAAEERMREDLVEDPLSR
jgi:hypothetical protein